MTFGEWAAHYYGYTGDIITSLEIDERTALVEEWQSWSGAPGDLPASWEQTFDAVVKQPVRDAAAAAKDALGAAWGTLKIVAIIGTAIAIAYVWRTFE